MMSVLSVIAAIVAMITGLAMLQDATPHPIDRTPRGWVRHVLRLAVLVGITAAAGVLLVVPAARGTSAYEVAFHCCLAGFMAMQCPCPWWRYVFKGRADTLHWRAPT